MRRSPHALKFLSLLVAPVLLALVGAPASAGNGTGLLQYVPESARVVVGVDVEKLRATDVWQRALALADSNAELTGTLTTLQAAGFDPRASVRSVVIASPHVSNTAGDQSVVFFEVDYPADAFANVLTEDGYEALTQGETRHFQKGGQTIAFLTPNTIALGSTALVAPALNVASGEGTAGATGRVARQIAAADKSGVIWAAVQFPSGTQGMQSGRVAIDLGSGLRLGVSVTMESDEAASTTVTQFNTQIAAVAGSPEVAAFGLEGVLTGLQASSEGSDISLSLSLDAATWTELVGKLAAVVGEQIR